MKKKLTIAGVQMSSKGTLSENLSKAGELIDIAAEKGAKIITLPQLFNCPWFPAGVNKEHFSLAEAEDGQSITSIRERAAENNVIIIASIFEKEGSEYFNTAFVLGEEGEIIGRYRKVHVPGIPLWEERSYFKPGDLGFPLFKTPYATIGVQLCWDIFFPEGFRILALKGAEVVFAPTASAFLHSAKKWERAISAAAHANGIFIFRANRVGKESEQDFYGKSFCVRPDGEFLVKPSGASEGIILSELELKDISTARSSWVFLKDRRPELYKEILLKDA
ncbi:MAG: nitrilase-related carbon-nitrogen hydrolase [Thermodesulfobacteriota bacterium]